MTSSMSASFPSTNIALIPVEFAHALNQTYFLHLLATDPIRVLPPGKSILSVLSTHQTSTPKDKRDTIQDQVENLVHRAFWDEALESLSNPQPSAQLNRLQHLYNDLFQALTPLFPRHHTILITLSSPLSPTPSPLLSAVTHLREILQALRERCAPARDASIDALLRSLDDPPLPANVVVNTTKAILELSAAMKNDLSQFVIGQMDEKQLKSLVVQQAREREREVVLGIWGEMQIRADWNKWVTENEQAVAGERWKLRVLQALGSLSPVSCNLPISGPNGTIHHLDIQPQHTDEQSVPPNALPPSFLFTTPSLLYIQNLLQSLVVSASLRSLIHLPHTSSGPGDNTPSPAGDFMQRIWTLLRAEIDGQDSPLSPGETGTKLVNLADEVVRAKSLTLDGGLQPAEETRLRSTVERTLQYHDPVFLLLQKRLMGVLAERLLRLPTNMNGITGAPELMRAGRDTSGTSKPDLKLPFNQVSFTTGEQGREGVLVKGFEDPVLVSGVGEVLERIRVCITWVEVVWGASIELNGKTPA